MRKIKILIAEDEEILRDVVEMILESEIEAIFLKAQNGAIAEDFLINDDEIDFIISDYTMPVKNGGQLFLYNKENKNLPFILASGGTIQDYPEFSNFKNINPLNVFIEKPFDEKILINSVKKVILSLPASVKKGPAEQVVIETKLIKMKLAHYMHYAQNADDVYISLNENKFVKITDANDSETLDLDLLKHYQEKGIEFIYIEKEKFDLLIAIYKNHLMTYQRPDQKITLASHIFHISLDCLKNLGMSDFHIESTNELVTESIKDLESNKNLYSKYKSVVSNEGYIIGHSMLIIYIASNIIKKTNLNFNPTLKKISMAALVHDIYLNNEELAIAEDLIKEVSENQRYHLFLHGEKAGQLLLANNELFDESKKILLEHHEKPDGSGYPKGINSSNISLLGSLFIICHDIATHLIQNNYDLNLLKLYLKNREEYYSNHHFSNFYNKAIEFYSESNH